MTIFPDQDLRLFTTKRSKKTNRKPSVGGQKSSSSTPENLWHERFQELVDFKKLHNHCNVPHRYPTNKKLAQWVKRQRYQYKLKALRRHSNLTDEREEQLDELGFVWDTHQAAWDDKFEELKQWKERNGHSSVPLHDPEKSLAIWVKVQRRQYNLFHSSSFEERKKSTITEDRIEKLNRIGFDWNPRKLKTRTSIPRK